MHCKRNIDGTGELNEAGEPVEREEHALVLGVPADTILGDLVWGEVVGGEGDWDDLLGQERLVRRRHLAGEIDT